MLIDEAQGRLQRYLSDRPEIVAVILFGSRARDEARPDSDLDLGVLLTREQAQLGVDRSALVTDLMEVFERPDIDVVILNDAPPLLLHRVVRDGHLLYATDAGVVAEFTIHAVQQYEDTRPMRKLQAERLQRQLAELRGERSGPT